ncbi:MAG: hypothetical protein KAR06_02925 [Deltaproteobacteria bacterium]|nr:hypothetical protein [Deltaproteobacteria bacterium]
MLTGDIAQWAATGVIFFALLFNMIKNGRAQKHRDEKMAKERAVEEAITQEKLKNIDEAVKSPVSGLAALKGDMNSIQTNCAKVTSGFTERFKAIEQPKRRR